MLLGAWHPAVSPRHPDPKTTVAILSPVTPTWLFSPAPSLGDSLGPISYKCEAKLSAYYLHHHYLPKTTNAAMNLLVPTSCDKGHQATLRPDRLVFSFWLCHLLSLCASVSPPNDGWK